MSYPFDPDDFQHAYGTWAARTWPHQTPDSVIAHLREEVEELGQTHESDEAADCLLLLLNHAHQHGYSLWAAARSKAFINQTRRWGPPDASGVSHHER